MSRAEQPGEYRHKTVETAPARHGTGRGHRFGEPWAVGAIGLAGLVVILYASAIYTQW